MLSATDLFIKFGLTLLLGGIVGVERELRSKSAGFRTIILICMGAMMFTVFSNFIGGTSNPDRIASNVVVGIGFIGAGVIFRGEKVVTGITTAASIWLAAALGMGVGCGYYIMSIIGCLLIVSVLFILSEMDERLDKLNQVREYRMVYPYELDQHLKYEKIFTHHRLSVKARSMAKNGNMITGKWVVTGNEKKHHAFIAQILKDPFVSEFDF
jgi:putative Mg2+ transporter-C (MgtC) family protein